MTEELLTFTQQLASIAHHRAWLDTMAMWRTLDPQAEVETGRRLRESTRMTSVSQQPFAAAWLRMLPSSHEKRIRSDKFLWAY